MIRLIILTLIIGLSSVAMSWLVDNKGAISLSWLGYQIDTDTSFVAISMLIFLALFYVIIKMSAFMGGIFGSSKYKRKIYNYERGLLRLTQGFTALSQGDNLKALKKSKEALKLLDNQPVALILAAKSADLEGEKDTSSEYYQKLLKNKETKYLATKDLLEKYIHENNDLKALEYANKAYDINPDSNAIALKLLYIYKKMKLWKEALAFIKKYDSRDKFSFTKHIREFNISEEKAKIYYMMAQNLPEQDAHKALIKGFEPAFPPIACALARSYFNLGKQKQALNIIEKSYQKTQHIDLNELFIEITKDDKDKVRIKKMLKLHKLNPNGLEPNILAANIYYINGDFDKARIHTKLAFIKSENVSLCNLMAEIAKKSSDNIEQEKWLERARIADSDPSWICANCNKKHSEWSVICSNCESVETINWCSFGAQSASVAPALL